MTCPEHGEDCGGDHRGRRPPVTAGREQDARETLRAVERLRRAALFGASASRAAAIAEDSDYILAALLPSPPTTTQCGWCGEHVDPDDHLCSPPATTATWAERNELAQAFHEGQVAGFETGIAFATDRANAAASSPPATDGDAVSARCCVSCGMSSASCHERAVVVPGGCCDSCQHGRPTRLADTEETP